MNFEIHIDHLHPRVRSGKHRKADLSNRRPNCKRGQQGENKRAIRYRKKIPVSDVESFKDEEYNLFSRIFNNLTHFEHTRIRFNLNLKKKI